MGPDDEYLKSNVIDYSLDESRRYSFYSSVKKFIPFLKEDDLFPDTTGIRPKLQGYREDFCDFVIREESENFFPCLINLIGIESPGLTASPAIALYVKSVIEKIIS